MAGYARVAPGVVEYCPDLPDVPPRPNAPLPDETHREWCRFDWHTVALTLHDGDETRLAAMRRAATHEGIIALTSRYDGESDRLEVTMRPRMKLTRTDRRTIKYYWPFGRVVLMKEKT